jgi:hypothetical protein
VNSGVQELLPVPSARAARLGREAGRTVAPTRRYT